MIHSNQEEDNKKLAVTVVTLCMGLTEGLKVTLSSVKKQNYQARHVLIDGSGLDEARKFCEDNYYAVDFFSLQPRGIYAAMNDGLKLIKKDSNVLFLNESDFLVGPDALSKLMSSFSLTRTWVFGGTIAFDKNSSHREVYGLEPPNWSVFKSGAILIPHPSTLVPANWLIATGSFKEHLKVASDLDMTFRLFKKFGPPNHIPYIVSAHELGGVSTTARGRSRFESRIARLLNFPVSTLFSVLKRCFYSLELHQKTIRKPAINFSGSQSHFNNCKKNEIFPLCCRLVLLE